MKQSAAFWDGEGNEWLKRNERKIPIENDLVLTAMRNLIGGVSSDSTILEIGCSNGWRLKKLEDDYGCTVRGIDPSKQAIEECTKNGIVAVRGHAQNLAYPNTTFDVVIYGFCLYLCDREDLFMIAHEGDRVLKDGGLLVIYDFNPVQPHKNLYKHKEGIWSYKQNYEDMFLWNPAYTKLITIYHQDGQTKAVVLKKSMALGWPSNESESLDLAV